MKHFNIEPTKDSTIITSGFSFNLKGENFVITTFAGYGLAGAKDHYYVENYKNYTSSVWIIGSIESGIIAVLVVRFNNFNKRYEKQNKTNSS